jgi:hypothetical protein
VRIFTPDDDDEVLVSEVAEQLAEQGMNEDEIEFTLLSMRDEGMFRCADS